MLGACSDDSSSNSAADVPGSSAVVPESSASVLESSASVLESSATVAESSVAIPESSAATVPESSAAIPESSAAAAQDTVWNKANLTWYISWPDPGSEECIVYNGCEWAGYFAGIDGQQTEEWVSQHNIISIHEQDWSKYKGKTFRLRQDGNTIDAVVYDMCSDEDCDGCCTENAGKLGFLIDIESYTCERFSGTKEGCDGVVEWTCLDCE